MARAPDDGHRPADADAAIRHLCARLFDDPSRLAAARATPVQGTLVRSEHAHADLLQLDLAVRCGGHWTVEGVPFAPRGVTAVVFYPREAHGYALRAAGREGMVYSLKLRVDRAYPVVAERALPAVQLNTPAPRALVRAAARLAQIGQAAARPATLSAAAALLVAWPRLGATSPGDPLEDPLVQRVVRLIEARPVPAPRLDELAEAVGLSPRHLARRFRAAAGCSPHAWVDRGRLARAQALLERGDASVTEVADALGFSSIHGFSRWFTRRAGRTPTAFRDRPPEL